MKRDIKPETLVGKTIESVKYVNPWEAGLFLHFTDGTCLNVYEHMQAGEIVAVYSDKEVLPLSYEGDSDD